MDLVVPLVFDSVGGCNIGSLGAGMVDRTAGLAFAGLPGNHAVGDDQITSPT